VTLCEGEPSAIQVTHEGGGHSDDSPVLMHPRGLCGFHKVTPREAREVLRGKSILFLGNSVSRRLMYAVADAMGGKRARVNVIATDAKAAAKYGMQRVWDSKANFHSFFEVPVSEAGGFVRSSTRPTLNRRAESARLHVHSC